MFVLACTGPDTDETEIEPKPEIGLLGEYSTTLPALAMPEGAKCHRPMQCLPPVSGWELELREYQLDFARQDALEGQHLQSPIEELSDPTAGSGTLVLGESQLR